MKTKFINSEIFYDGTQLKPLYGYVHHQLHGNSALAFIGGCNVSLDHMVDAEDFVVHAEIKSNKMLHFIVECFDTKLFTAVVLQRLLVSMVQNHLLNYGVKLTRSGDDLYSNDKKLSISIASCSAVSSMIHFAMNITNEGTPVPTCSLEDFKIEPVKLATEILQSFQIEFNSMVEATQKVKPLS